MTKQERKGNLVNEYQILVNRLDELYDSLTVRQVRELEGKLTETWVILERRKAERRLT